MTIRTKAILKKIKSNERKKEKNIKLTANL